MDEREQMTRLAQRILDAWNTQDVEKVVACYTPDLRYRDPNTRGLIEGADAFRRYLTKLFANWKMHWSMREAFLLADGRSSAFLWRARLEPVAGGAAAEVDGMDLAIVSDGKLARNEVYFDRAALAAASGGR